MPRRPRLHRTALFALLLLGPGLAPALALAEEPFRELTFDQALSTAKKEKKLVMVDFYATWCGPCKMLDRTTWKDEKVQAWLKKSTVPLKIDAEKERELASRYHINAYPTMVFIQPDGTVKGRLRGYLPPEQFVGQAEAAVTGEGALGAAKASVKASPNDPNAHVALADALSESGKQKEALAEMVWAFDHGLENDPGFAKARATTLLGSMSELAKEYPPARQALVERRAAARAKLIAGAADPVARDDLPRLDFALGQRDSTIRVFEELKNLGPSHEESRRAIGVAISDLLFERQRYADFLACAGDMTGKLESLLSKAVQAEAEVDSLPNGDQKRAYIGQQLTAIWNASLQGYEALLGGGKKEDADRVAQAILAFRGNAQTFERLANAADRVGDSATALKWRGLDSGERPSEPAMPADSTVRFDEG